VTRKILLAAVAAVLCLSGSAAAQPPAAGTDGGRFYGRAEYLLWWTKDGPNQVPLVSKGFVGAPGTEILIGGTDTDFGAHHGARLTLGYWLTNDRAWGVEASGFYLPSVSESRTVSSPDATGAHLSIPFFNTNLGRESSSPLSASSPGEGFFGGTATQEMTSRLWGVEGNVVFALANPRPVRLELLGGFRYLNLAEGFSFLTNTPDNPPGPITVFQTRDAFDATNDFYGGQIGVRGRYEAGRFMADATLKLALGAMRQHVDVAGSLTTNFFGPTVQTFPGGYFTQRSNIGSYTRTVFAVIPEVGVNVGFRLTSWASVVAGYTFLYASNVARPGHQVDRGINPTQSQAISLTDPATLVGAARPAFKFDGSDFWAHGLNIGIALNF
jgi:hypothetical protein